MPTDADALERMIRRPEGETIDFKATMYELSDAKSARDFAKDIACMANTPRDDAAFIIVGVKKTAAGDYEVWGLEDPVDDANFQNSASSKLSPAPRFSCEFAEYEGRRIGIFTIPLNQPGPIVPQLHVDHGFQRGTVYFRRGSSNDKANVDDLRRIFAFFEGRDALNVDQHPQFPSPWKQYLDRVADFDGTRRHVLVSTLVGEADEALSGIGTGPWTYVLDMDPNSDDGGLLSAVRDEITAHRALHLRVKGESISSRSSAVSTTWFFGRGLAGRRESLAVGDYRTWRREYTRALQDELNELTKEIGLDHVVFTILCADTALESHLRAIVEEADVVFGEHASYILVTEHANSFDEIADLIGAQRVLIPLDQFAAGLSFVQLAQRDPHREGLTIPSISGAPIELEPARANWIAEEIDLVPANQRLAVAEVPSPFLRGGLASWTELDAHIDATRDVQVQLMDVIAHDLQSGRATRINLYHRPGAGGTTVARRAVWEMHSRYPSGVLRRTNAIETADRVSYLSSMSGLPVFLMMDGGDIEERQLDELAEYFGAQHVPVVLLQVFRRANRESIRERAFDLGAQLSEAEATRFVSSLARDVPGRRGALNALANDPDRQLHQPVYFALTAFDVDFQGLDRFVSLRVADLDSAQSEAIAFLAIALRYGQKAVPASALRGIFGLPTREWVDLRRLLPQIALDLLVEAEPGEWRIGHHLVADQILKIMLNPGDMADERAWRNQLADWGIKYAEFCRGRDAVPNNTMLELVRRTFVYRESLEVLGTERARQRRFAEFLEEIPVSEGKLRVLKRLVELYPDEAHFWAHLARFYGLERADYGEALRCADIAVDLSDKDPLLYHMRGMVRRYLADAMQRRKAAIGEVTAVAEQASVDFARSRDLNPESEHSYVAEAQLLLRLLDYVRRVHGDLHLYVGQRSVPILLRDAFDRIESLLAQVRQWREGVGRSHYEMEASASLRQLYGDYAGAIQQWDAVLARPDAYRPPIRRQIVWAMLGRAEGDWSMLRPRQVRRAVDLLLDNLREEPGDDRNLRLWLQAARMLEEPRPVEEAIEQVQYWKAAGDSLEAAYYLYVLNAILALEGSGLAFEQYERYVTECRDRARFQRRRTRSYEWLGDGQGLAQLVHQSRLGEWDEKQEFWADSTILRRVNGRVSRINGPQAGEVELASGVKAFFVPSRAGLVHGDENRQVSCHIGCSYDGLRAWNVNAGTVGS